MSTLLCLRRFESLHLFTGYRQFLVKSFDQSKYLSSAHDNDERKNTYLGFDLSTQKLKAVALSAELKPLATAEVVYDVDLPAYKTVGGATSGPNPNEYFANPVMWVQALSMVLDRLAKEGVRFETIAAIGGSGQQHGSVYWSEHGVKTLQCLDHNHPLHEQLDHSAFAVKQSPLWMDASTEQQCAEMEKAVGGAKEMVNITGSKCYERFTGPQIRKIFQKQQKAYADTKRISLVSSFLASIFIGNVAPIDYADGSGMNLLDINNRSWSKACLTACAPDLENRLGRLVYTNDLVGDVCDFFIKRYGFSPNCKVAAFTGDNPSALSGMLLRENWLVVSLGTSDTVLMHLESHPKLPEGHVLCHPTEPCEFMGMLCFRNGSLVRESVKRDAANDDWDNFNNLLKKSPKGNGGNMAIHYPDKEIIPIATGILRWTSSHSPNSADAMEGIMRFEAPETEVRALIEGQFLWKRAVARQMGFNFGQETKIIATGGASVNLAILQVISDVFNAPVYTQKEMEAALFGAAYRAKYALYVHNGCDSPVHFSDYIIQYIPNHLERTCEPSKGSEEIYVPMIERCTEMQKVLIQKSNKT